MCFIVCWILTGFYDDTGYTYIHVVLNIQECDYNDHTAVSLCRRYKMTSPSHLTQCLRMPFTVFASIIQDFVLFIIITIVY